jgi:SAM-dependent methyltransferase
MNSSPAVVADAGTAWYWANAYKVSVALFALLELGVLEALSGASHSAATLSHALKLSQTALEPTLQLVASVGVLEYAEGRFTLPPSTAAVLPLLLLEGHMSNTHIRRDVLVDVLKGTNAIDPMTRADAAELWPTYLAAMAVSTRTLAPHLIRLLRRGSEARLLDLGGADGALALRLSQFFGRFEATVIDRAQLEPAFHERVGKADDRAVYRFVAGDLRCPQAFAHEIARADVVVLSNVLHLLTSHEQHTLLQTLYDHMRPGAQLLVYDQFSPADVAFDTARFMVLDWLLCGYQFDCSEVTFGADLSRLGFADVLYRRPPGLPGAIIGCRMPVLQAAGKDA